MTHYSVSKFSALVVLVCCPAFALAQMATEETQLLNFAQLSGANSTLASQLATLQRDVMKLSAPTWSDTTAALKALEAIIEKGNAVAYTASNLNSKFAAMFPTYSKLESADMSNQFERYSQWSSTVNSTALASLQVAQAHSALKTTEQTKITAAEGEVTYAQGNLQVQQALAQIQVATLDQISKLRQEVLTLIQLQSTYFAAQQAQQDQDLAALHKWATVPTKPASFASF